MARGKPAGSKVSSRPTTLLDEQEQAAARALEVFEEEIEGGRKWQAPGVLAQRCNERWANGWQLERLLSTGGNEYIFLWKRRET